MNEQAILLQGRTVVRGRFDGTRLREPRRCSGNAQGLFADDPADV